MAATTFRVLLVGSGWLSSRRTAPSLLVSSASTAGLGGWNAGLKSSDCPFRPPPVIAPSSPQSPRTPILPMGPRPDQTFRDGCCHRRLLFFKCVGHICGAELFLIRRTLLLSALLCSANRRQRQNVCVSHSQHHPWIDASIPAKSTRPHRAFLLAIYDPMMMPYANATASFFLPM